MLVLDEIPVKAWITEYKRQLVLLAGARLLEGLLVLLSAWELSCIVSGIFLEHSSISEAAPHFGVLLFAMLAKNLDILQQKDLCSRLSHQFRARLRTKIHAALLLEKDASPRGSLQATALESVDALDEFFRLVLPLLLSALLGSPLCLMAMLFADPPTALLFLLTLPIAPLLLYLIGRVTKSASQKQWQELFRLNTEFAELLQGLFTLKLFRREQAQESRLQKICHSFSAASLKVLQIAFVSAFALELITTLSIALIAVSIGLRLLAGHMEFDCAFFALLLAPEFYHPLRQGGTAFHTFMNCRTAWEHIRECLEKQPSPRAPRHRDKIQHPPALHVSGLSFSYTGKQHPVLSNISFTLPPGSFTVLTGTSGSGKSTLLRLLSGSLTPTRGNISLNEFPLEEIFPEDLPRHMAYVPQEPHVFSASLRDNVTLFHKAEDARIREALEQAGLGTWFRTL
ncbi:MAG: ATP-binding cassette domain-containing protein, partial [Selenomonadaceae bacterium]|nr:ATP-binding cassette domain-containing protein [Selenomonadaceae bacterium]